jgi:hypothetical protein
MDYSRLNAILGFGIVTAVLASATADHPPNLRQASMPHATLLYLAGSQLVVTGIMSRLGWKTPVRLSSNQNLMHISCSGRENEEDKPLLIAISNQRGVFEA